MFRRSQKPKGKYAAAHAKSVNGFRLNSLKDQLEFFPAICGWRADAERKTVLCKAVQALTGDYKFSVKTFDALLSLLADLPQDQLKTFPKTFGPLRNSLNIPDSIELFKTFKTLHNPSTCTVAAPFCVGPVQKRIALLKALDDLPSNNERNAVCAMASSLVKKVTKGFGNKPFMGDYTMPERTSNLSMTLSILLLLSLRTIRRGLYTYCKVCRRISGKAFVHSQPSKTWKEVSATTGFRYPTYAHFVSWSVQMNMTYRYSKTLDG